MKTINLEIKINKNDFKQKLGIRDGKNGKDGIGINGKNGSPDTSSQIIEKINESDEQIDRERVKGLDELEKSFDTKISSIPRGGGARSNNSTKFYPLTADSSTKIFSVPKSVASIVLMSDFPHILFENSGFTINGPRTQITLTVDNAPTTGSQLLYQYSSMFN